MHTPQLNLPLKLFGGEIYGQLNWRLNNPTGVNLAAIGGMGVGFYADPVSDVHAKTVYLAAASSGMMCAADQSYWHRCRFLTAVLRKYGKISEVHFYGFLHRLRGQFMTNLTNLQKRIASERENCGFVTDPVKLAVLLSEEVGEIASEIKRLWSKNYDQFCANRLEEEIADAFVVLAALANQFDIDIEEAIERKFFDKDAQREWKSAQVRKR